MMNTRNLGLLIGAGIAFVLGIASLCISAAFEVQHWSDLSTMQLIGGSFLIACLSLLALALGLHERRKASIRLKRFQRS